MRVTIARLFGPNDGRNPGANHKPLGEVPQGLCSSIDSEVLDLYCPSDVSLI